MDHEQRAAHLALQGWEAWLENGLFNITHPKHGTVWCSCNDPNQPCCDQAYKYFVVGATPTSTLAVPPKILSAMEAKIPWLELEGMWDE